MDRLNSLWKFEIISLYDGFAMDFGIDSEVPQQNLVSLRIPTQKPAPLQVAASPAICKQPPNSPVEVFKMNQHPTLSYLCNRTWDELMVRDPPTYTFLHLSHRGSTIRVLELFSLHGIHEVIFAYRDLKKTSKTVFRINPEEVAPLKISYAIGELLPGRHGFNKDFEVIVRGGSGEIALARNLWGVETGGHVCEEL